MTPTTPANGCGFELYRDPWARLVLVDAQSREHTGVEAVRAFPISDGDHWIFLVDSAGHELMAIDDLRSLPEGLREILEEELARREFVPVIQRVLSVSAESDPSEWHVETDRGQTQFTLNDDEDIRMLSPHRALVVDAHGIRYLIPDLRTLDPPSRRLLDRFF